MGGWPCLYDNGDHRLVNGTWICICHHGFSGWRCQFNDVIPAWTITHIILALVSLCFALYGLVLYRRVRANPALKLRRRITCLIFFSTFFCFLYHLFNLISDNVGTGFLGPYWMVGTWSEGLFYLFSFALFAQTFLYWNIMTACYLEPRTNILASYHRMRPVLLVTISIVGTLDFVITRLYYTLRAWDKHSKKFQFGMDFKQQYLVQFGSYAVFTLVLLTFCANLLPKMGRAMQIMTVESVDEDDLLKRPSWTQDELEAWLEYSAVMLLPAEIGEFSVGAKSNNNYEDLNKTSDDNRSTEHSRTYENSLSMHTANLPIPAWLTRAYLYVQLFVVLGILFVVILIMEIIRSAIYTYDGWIAIIVITMRHVDLLLSTFLVLMTTAKQHAVKH